MRKLTKSVQAEDAVPGHIWERIIVDFSKKKLKKEDAIQLFIKAVSTYDKYLFYPLIGEILAELGFNVSVTRDGDTNNRADAMIIDKINSIPIEIKSPTEVENINIKSIRQALENKIVLLSRKFYPTKPSCTSLAIGYKYPEKRSDVHELIENYKETYGFNIGIIDLASLLDIHWQIKFENVKFNQEKMIELRGQYK